MVYASGGLIEAIDYNNFVASVNAIWGTGGTPTLDYGYGQATTLSNVAISNTVSHSEWATLINRLDSMDFHQTNTSSGITAPTANTTITYLSTIGSLLGTLTTNRLTTSLTKVSATTTMTNATTWTTSSVKEIRITWPNSDAMRYFFSAGGNVQFTGRDSILSNNNKSLDWDLLLSNCGFINIMAQTSNRTSAAGTATIDPNTVQLGFYDLTTTYQILCRQFSATATGGYTSNFATFEAKLNGTAGTAATQLDLRMTLNDNSADETLPANSNNVQGTVEFDVIVNAPSSSYLTNVWGTPTNNPANTLAPNIYPTLVTNTQA